MARITKITQGVRRATPAAKKKRIPGKPQAKKPAIISAAPHPTEKGVAVSGSRGKQSKDVHLKRRVAARLHAARFAYCESQTEVARRLKVTSQVLSAAETGRNYPDLSMLVRFCLLTECSMDWLILGKRKTAMPMIDWLRICTHFPEFEDAPAEALEQVLAGA